MRSAVVNVLGGIQKDDMEMIFDFGGDVKFLEMKSHNSHAGSSYWGV